MNRRRQVFNDPTSTRALGVPAFEELVHALAPLDELERQVILLRFGLLGGPPMSVREVARVFDKPQWFIEVQEQHLLRNLRYAAPSLSDLLYDEALPPVPDSVRARLMGLVPPSLYRCERHGWVVVPNAAARCAICLCPVDLADRGRHRHYCGGACKQAAYRRRRMLQGTTDARPEAG